MAFKKKTWTDRMVEYAGRRKLTNVSTKQAVIYDVERSEGTVSKEGDAFSSQNMNDLEQRVADGFSEVKQTTDGLIQNLQWEKVGELTGTTAKNIDFSRYQEIYLVTRCSGNMTLAYTVIIPVAFLISTALQFCNGGYTSGVGAQCAWNVSLGSCQLVACYSGGTNYTGSNTIIYAR